MEVYKPNIEELKTLDSKFKEINEKIKQLQQEKEDMYCRRRELISVDKENFYKKVLPGKYFYNTEEDSYIYVITYNDACHCNNFTFTVMCMYIFAGYEIGQTVFHPDEDFIMKYKEITKDEFDKILNETIEILKGTKRN